MSTTTQDLALAALCEARTALDAACSEASDHHALVDDAEQIETFRLIRAFGAALDQVDDALRIATDALIEVDDS
jgi:hypothetical protein